MTILSTHPFLELWRQKSAAQLWRRLLAVAGTAVIIWWLLRERGVRAIWELLTQVELT